MLVGVLVLAAGRSTRYGGDKRMATLSNDDTVLQRTLFNVAEAGLPVLACVAGDDNELAAELRGRSIPVYQCINSMQGMGATLAEGMLHCSSWDAVIVALADMPWVHADTFCALAAAVTPTTIWVPYFDGNRGNPVAFGSKYFNQLASLSGDTGARSLLQDSSAEVERLDVTDSGICRDVDRPEDLQGL
jgi:molybdenum cofactor cytidylyltransferase